MLTRYQTLTSIMHLGEIKDKKKPLFVAFLGEFNEFAQSVLDFTTTCLSSYHTQEV